tara:strand:- start:213 stop:371 length:159 start_codon:yes stop_codon:yes gene_type:complete
MCNKAAFTYMNKKERREKEKRKGKERKGKEREGKKESSNILLLLQNKTHLMK